MTPGLIAVSIPVPAACAGIGAWAAVRIALPLIAWRKALTTPGRGKTAPKAGTE